jgi:HEAT repeat protein
MADRRVIEYHMGRLTDKNPDVRLKAIHELGLLGATDALGTLQQLFETDPDPGVRQAAREAGRAIFRKQHSQGV